MRLEDVLLGLVYHALITWVLAQSLHELRCVGPCQAIPPLLRPLLGLKPGDLGYIRIGEERGLGTMRYDSLRIKENTLS